eukprot:gene37723-50930_t
MVTVDLHAIKAAVRQCVDVDGERGHAGFRLADRVRCHPAAVEEDECVARGDAAERDARVVAAGAAAKYPVGAKLSGRVTNITEYGAFVELEAGIEGLVHVSEMSWTKKNVHPGKIVSTSQEVEVVVLEVDPDKRRISLGLKQAHANPWEAFAEAHPVGSTVEGEVKNATEFGLFIGLDNDVDGMVHMSDIAWGISGEDALNLHRKGETVKAVVLDIDAEKERISLGMKQLERGGPSAGVAAAGSSGRLRLRPSKGAYNAGASTMGVLRRSSARAALMAQDCGETSMGVNFVDLRDAGDPVEQAQAYDAAGADELCFLDIGASHEGRGTIIDVVRRTAEVCFMPLTVGGGVRRPDDADDRNVDCGKDVSRHPQDRQRTEDQDQDR